MAVEEAPREEYERWLSYQMGHEGPCNDIPSYDEWAKGYKKPIQGERLVLPKMSDEYYRAKECLRQLERKQYSELSFDIYNDRDSWIKFNEAKQKLTTILVEEVWKSAEAMREEADRTLNQ